MDTSKFIEQCLNQVYERLTKSLEVLTAEGLVWRPAPHANCIAEILWHMVRSEDRMIRSRIGLGPEVWESRQYYNLVIICYFISFNVIAVFAENAFDPVRCRAHIVEQSSLLHSVWV